MESVPRRAEPSGRSYTTTMSDVEGAYYLAPITVGGQHLNVIMDSGSLETVLISKTCQTCGDTSKAYDPSASGTTSKNRTMTLSYGSGRLFVRDLLEDISLGPWEVKRVRTWEVLTAEMPLLQQTNFAGIVGLGPWKSNMELLTQKEALSSFQWQLGVTRYSVCLGRVQGTPGHLTWNHPVVQGKRFKELNIMPNLPWWVVRLNNVRMGGVSLGCNKWLQGCGAIIDSGTSLLAMPSVAKTHIENIVKAKSCEEFASLPPLEFDLDGKYVSMPAHYFFGKVYGAHLSTVNETNLQTSNESEAPCQAMLLQFDHSVKGVGDMWIMGMPFLRKFYTVFEQTPVPKIFIAEASSDCTLSTAPQFHSEMQRPMSFNASKLRFPLGGLESLESLL